MKPWLIVAAILYVVLALAHSWLGERKVLRPLLRADWQIGVPRGFAERLLRWAWHATSLAWLAAAAIVGWAASGRAMPPAVLDVIGGLALASAAIIGVPLRGAHPAWAVFAATGLACLVGAHGWPAAAAVRIAVGGVAVAALAAISALHVYWAAGGRWGARVAVPTRVDGTSLLAPSRAATVAVAVIVLAAAVIIASAAGVAPRAPWVRELGLAVAAVFGLRMIGDFRVAGLFKRERRTPFARWDSMLFSPLCGALCVACAIAAA